VPHKANLLRVMPITTQLFSKMFLDSKNRAAIHRHQGLRFTDTWVSDARSCTFGQLHADNHFKTICIWWKKHTLQVLEKVNAPLSFRLSSNRHSKTTGNSDYQNAFKSAPQFRCAVNGRKFRVLQKQKASKASGEFPLAPTKPMITLQSGWSWWRQWGTINENGIVKIFGSDLLRLLGSLCKWTNWHVSFLQRELPFRPWHTDLLMGCEVRSCGLILTEWDGRSEDYVMLYVTARRIGPSTPASHSIL